MDDAQGVPELLELLEIHARMLFFTGGWHVVAHGMVGSVQGIQRTLRWVRPSTLSVTWAKPKDDGMFFPWVPSATQFLRVFAAFRCLLAPACYTAGVMGKKSQFRVGCSGYQYDDWPGRFYPRDLPKTQWFAHYAEHFDTVEINNTFYRLPEAETFARWRKAAPEGFCYAIKFSRYGTHLKRLKDPRDTIGLFIDRAGRLRGALGPILVQLPPNWRVDVDRLAEFLEAAPGRYRWAVEFRDRSWLCREIYDLLEQHDAALVIHDMLDDHPRVVTADWVYLRFHGDDYGGSYGHQALTGVARRVKKHLQEGRDVYAYFNNDQRAAAVGNALDLRRYVEGD